MPRAWVFPDNIDTDVLAPGAYMKFDIEEIARHCMEAVDPEFASRVRPGDVVVGGRNFGMGSSREQAPQALKQLGVAAVIAPSFGGIFYRNALNLGLVVLECRAAGRIRARDDIAFDARTGSIRNRTAEETLSCVPIPGHLLDMVSAGGLLPYLAQRRRANERK
jgi:3-isopropylmalate/(R)-2-methylmalate dehydratase small subunit